MNKKKITAIAAMAMITSTAIAGNSLFTIKGQVKDSRGKGIANIVVNNGISFTTTNANGQWTLNTDTCISKFVYISTPSAYELPQRDGLAMFYIPIKEAVKKSNNEFILKKRTKPSTRFTYLAISDPQVLNEEEVKRWRNETVKDLKHTADSLDKNGEVIGMTLGDLVFDTPWLFDDYAATCRNLGFTMFQTIGNHDFDKQFQDLHNSRRGGMFAEHNYYREFGPTDYSFNIGNIHVITLKDIDYMGDRKYTETISDQQLDWLEKDLSYVPKGSTVFLNMHAAGWNKDDNEGNIRTAKQLENVLKGYNVHVFCGHTHYYQNIIVSDSLYQHNIGAACGAWWAGNVNQCGAPNGYLIVNVDGNNVKWHFKPTKASVNTQMRVYLPGQFRRAKKYLVANVWDYDPECSVTYSEDGVEKGKMNQFTAIDEMYIRQQNALNKDESSKVLTSHLFRCLPSENAKSITVTFTNRFGEKYCETVAIKEK